MSPLDGGRKMTRVWVFGSGTSAPTAGSVTPRDVMANWSAGLQPRRFAAASDDAGVKAAPEGKLRGYHLRRVVTPHPCCGSVPRGDSWEGGIVLLWSTKDSRTPWTQIGKMEPQQLHCRQVATASAGERLALNWWRHLCSQLQSLRGTETISDYGVGR
jgi:hypothetical protein